MIQEEAQKQYRMVQVNDDENLKSLSHKKTSFSNKDPRMTAEQSKSILFVLNANII